MKNREIAKVFKNMALLMELHEENEFKIKAIKNIEDTLENIATEIDGKSVEDIEALGLSKSASQKIVELTSTGNITDLANLLAKTPPTLLKLFEIKGLGAKKVRTLWKTLEIESLEQLKEACLNNKIGEAKGFGEKTQENILSNILFIENNASMLRFDQAELLSEELQAAIQKISGVLAVEVAGEMARKAEVIATLKLLVACKQVDTVFEELQNHVLLETDTQKIGLYCWRGRHIASDFSVEIYVYPHQIPASELYIHSAQEKHLEKIMSNGKSIFQNLYQSKLSSQIEIQERLGIPYVIPEMREGIIEFDTYQKNPHFKAIEIEDLKGALHNHSTYSDGSNTLLEMASKCQAMGLEYFGIADHSKSGNFYNGGMYEEKVMQQHKEIDSLNQTLRPFKIFKGIEVDILALGQLDYSDEILATFDYVVASIHANLNMDIEKATQRLIKAIEHPSTTILGHACGRLLLRREGYPLDYTKIIDACASNGVSIEINANPMRLDMDWRYVIKALEKEIVICINPDAHHVDGLEDMKYGVNVARKAGLTPEMTLNAWPLERVEAYFKRKK
jgi:DNA polymerase (family 10)